MSFTGHTMRLSELARSAKEILVRRDCDLSHVAKIPSLLEKRVVPCTKPAHLAAALEESEVVGVIVPEELESQVPAHLGLAVSDKPTPAANTLHEALCDIPNFHWNGFPSRIDVTAVVHPTAYIALNDVVIGPRTVVHPNSVILPRSIIGADCAIGPGSVVGTDAFEVNTGLSPQRILKQAGGVWLSDHVEMQAKCTIVRATFGGFTQVGRECKFDCQIHLAHDCRVGERVLFAACAEISGRVSIGDDAFIGPNCSISNGVTIGARSHVTIGAVVVKDIAEGGRVSGNFAVPHERLISHIKSIC